LAHVRVPSRPIDECQRSFEGPKTPSATRRLTSAPRWTRQRTSGKAQSSEEPVAHTIASHRSPAKPTAERQRHVRAPKNPSAAYFRRHKAPRGTFRRASALSPGSEEPIDSASTRFPAPGGTFRRASGPCQASEETVNRSSTRFPAPGGTLPTSISAESGLRRTHRQCVDPLSSPAKFSDERPSHVRAPKNPSMKHRPAFQLRRVFHRASGPRQASEEAVNSPSTQIQSSGGAHPRASEPPRRSEDHLHDSSTRIRTPGNSSPNVGSAPGLRRDHLPTVGVNQSFQRTLQRTPDFASSIRRRYLQKRCLASEDSESTWQVVCFLLDPEESARKRRTHRCALVEHMANVRRVTRLRRDD
jgi:hypothetical protein